MMTDEEMDRLVERLEARLADRFFHSLGKGLWGFVWKAVVIVCLVLALYGAGVKAWPLPKS